MKSNVLRSPTFSKTVLSMAGDDDLDKVQLTSARKEIMFDEKSGRFFETDLDAVECIPEEEYCRIDEETGEKIRLTVAEKERIFLDALQVRITLKFEMTNSETFAYLTIILSYSSLITHLEDNCLGMKNLIC